MYVWYTIIDDQVCPSEGVDHDFAVVGGEAEVAVQDEKPSVSITV